MNQNKSNLHKYIFLAMILFLLLNLCPITIVTCDKEHNTCKCVQFFNVLMKRKYVLKEIALNDIQQSVYYKEESSKNQGFLNNLYPGHGVGIELKEKQRVVFSKGEKGDYIIPFYDTFSKTTTESFVDKFNNYLQNENEKCFKDIHVNTSFIILAIIIFLYFPFRNIFLKQINS